MNRTFALLGTLAAVSTPILASAQTPLTLFPLKKGTTWQFSTTIQGKAIVQDVTVTDVTPKGSAQIATVDYKVGGSTIQTEVYQIDAKGIARMRAGVGSGGSVTPPIPVLPAKITPGAKWTWKGKINAQGKDTPGSADFTLLAPEKISVPAGKFNAWRVRFFLNVSNGTQGTIKIENSYWFAPNVGIVKQEVKVGTQSIVGSLTKYSVAK